MNDFGEGKFVKGSKPYQCEACGAQIPIGEKHWHQTGMWEGDWQDWRAHKECYDDWSTNGYGELQSDAPVPERLNRGRV